MYINSIPDFDLYKQFLSYNILYKTWLWILLFLYSPKHNYMTSLNLATVLIIYITQNVYKIINDIQCFFL